MTARVNSIALLVVSLCAGTHSKSYDVGTHAAITQKAYQASGVSRTGAGSVVEAIGLAGWMDANPRAPFRVGARDSYFEMGFGSPSELQRFAQWYELSQMPQELRPSDSAKANGWLMRGAIREDDGGPLIPLYSGEPAFELILGPKINRFCNHFFDPIKSRNGEEAKLRAFCNLLDPNYDAVQWALGALSPFAAPQSEWTDRLNHFSILDAREAMWRALTLRDRAGNPAPSLGLEAESARKVYWATTFRILGDVLHMVQDMAQPQHTRNESHKPPFATSSAGYEEYVEARATRAAEYTIDGKLLVETKGQIPELNWTPYPVPTFSRYSDYWRSLAFSAARRGLADYSNRGFYTPASNIGNTNYALPAIIPSSANRLRTTIPDHPGVPFNYITGTVSDDVTGASDTITMSTEGIFNGLVSQGSGIPIAPLYSLTQKNYDDRADLLIKRAVAYSAGVLDYFFRGSLEISLPDAGIYGIVDHSAQSVKDTGGFNKIRLKIRNTTAAITPPGETVPVAQGMTGGILVAVVKFHRNDCYKADLTGEYGSPEAVAVYLDNVFNDPNPPAQSTTPKGCRFSQEEIVVSSPSQLPGGALLSSDPAKEVAFDFATRIPINATDVILQVVFRGPLGEEQDAVVVTTKDISEPTFVSTHNATDFYGPPGTAERRNLTIQFGFSPTNATLVSSVDLKPGEFSRVAVLADVGSIPVFCSACVVPQDTFQSALNQLGSPASTYYKLRTVVFGQRKLGLPGNPSQFILQPILGDAVLNTLAPAVLVPLQALPF